MYFRVKRAIRFGFSGNYIKFVPASKAILLSNFHIYRLLILKFKFFEEYSYFDGAS